MSGSVEQRDTIRGNVLIVDDEQYILKSITRQLRGQGLNVLVADTGAKALQVLQDTLIDVMFLDLKLPDMDGMDILRRSRQVDPETVVVVMTGYATIKTAIEAIREGAYEFLTKPFEGTDLIPITVNRALQYKGLRDENRRLEGMISGQVRFTNMAGASAAMQRLLRLAERLSNIESTVLITGESGTGKEVLARAIHFGGCRRNQKFVPVDCGAIPENIIESELFGHVKGSFTGAVSSSKGLLKQADKGTALLDEIGELPYKMQTKLLRFLQEKEVRPVGGGVEEKVDVRIITATNKDLAAMVRENKFREDLFYRLNVVSIKIPPLRERPEDIPALIGFFMKKYEHKLGRKVSISPEAFDCLVGYHWPGNARELENFIVHNLSLSMSDVIRLEDLPANIRSVNIRPRKSVGAIKGDLPLSRGAYEKAALERALLSCGGSVTRAARVLDVGKSTLYRKIRQFGIDVKNLTEPEEE